MSRPMDADVAHLICGNIDDLRNSIRGAQGENRDLLTRALASLSGRETKTKRKILEAALRKLPTPVVASQREAHNCTINLAPAEAAPAEVVPTQAQIYAAFAACRSIKFACDNASRHGGEFSLTDIHAADRLAREALTPNATGGAS